MLGLKGLQKGVVGSRQHFKGFALIPAQVGFGTAFRALLQEAFGSHSTPSHHLSPQGEGIGAARGAASHLQALHHPTIAKGKQAGNKGSLWFNLRLWLAGVTVLSIHRITRVTL